MKIAAIIAEYNPFHNGHAYQISQIKKTNDYDYVIVIMSGDFTQRGTPAILDKYERTKMALNGGADLVLELPACYATASAEFFASGAVSILNSLGCIDALFFGSESGNCDMLQKAASCLAFEAPAYKAALNHHLQQGMSFAKARIQALEVFDTFTASELEALSMPNDILGLEYCKALLHTNSSMEPRVIKRIGTGYHDLHHSGNIASASAIRSKLFSEHTAGIIDTLVPKETASILQQDDGRTFLFTDDFSSILHYQLWMQENHLEEYQDCTVDIANRIRTKLPSFTCISEFLLSLKTKELTYTRLSRVLTHILLSITRENFASYTQDEYAGYARVLGFSANARGTLLSVIKKNTALPLIAKPADFIPSGIQSSMFHTDILSSHIYQSVRMKKSGIKLIPELKHSPIIL